MIYVSVSVIDFRARTSTSLVCPEEPYETTRLSVAEVEDALCIVADQAQYVVACRKRYDSYYVENKNIQSNKIP